MKVSRICEAVSREALATARYLRLPETEERRGRGLRDCVTATYGQAQEAYPGLGDRRLSIRAVR
jgi:hypothetical protein